ncbi:MAG: hypothetical protein QOE92_266 [Chloroflexota bacterium]|jgi:hypothetical protein|nr:hypothetical protein [Chloroflexota bacterium]
MSSTQPPQGEVAASPLRLRPLTVSEIFDESFRLYRGNFGNLVALALISVVPGLIYNLLYVQALGGANGSFLGGSRVSGDPFASFNFAYLALGFLILLVSAPISSGLLYQATIYIAAGYRPSVGTVLTNVLRRYPDMLIVTIITWLCVVPAFTCVGIVVTVWLLVAVSLATPALFAEGKGGMDALRRSWDLSQNSWWRLFGILILSALMVFVISLAAEFFLGLVLGLIPALSVELKLTMTQLAAAVARALVAPVVPVITCLLYFDRRVRSEALELDILASQAVAPASIPPAPPPAAAI